MRELLLTAACAMAACAGGRPAAAPAPGPELRVEVFAGGARFEVVHAPGDDDAARLVAGALQAAAARAARWGSLRAAVTVVVHPTREAFQAAVGGAGWPALRAWAGYDVVDLESPRRWWPLGAGAREVEDVLAHELTHCVAYQRGLEPASWSAHDLPFWFLEGMATAVPPEHEQELRDRVARWYDGGADPEDDPISRPERLARTRPELAYAAAHVAFRALVALHGEEAAGRVLDRMRRGTSFTAAFQALTGTSVARFEAAVRDDVARRAVRAAR